MTPGAVGGEALPETFSNLTGKRIGRIRPNSVEDVTIIDLTERGFCLFKPIELMVWR